ncbi:MAG TPA: hypothetical protein VG457_08175, partial [Planctomycetota bacterium]|nr:hypothetical protein [Planctomycetota bacterium]
MPKVALTALATCLCLSMAVAADRAEPDARELRRTGDIAIGAAGLVAPPTAEVVRTRTLEWVVQRVGADKARLEEIGKLWGLAEETPSAQGLFDLTIQSFSQADEATHEFVKACNLQQATLLPPEAKVLDQAEAGRFYVANLSLFYGRYLAHRQMFEESLEVLNRTSIAEVVDPASLLFFKAVCQHHLLMKVEGLATIDQLLKNTEGVPVRYSTVAALMQFDLEAL